MNNHRKFENIFTTTFYFAGVTLSDYIVRQISFNYLLLDSTVMTNGIFDDIDEVSPNFSFLTCFVFDFFFRGGSFWGEGGGGTKEVKNLKFTQMGSTPDYDHKTNNNNNKTLLLAYYTA